MTEIGAARAARIRTGLRWLTAGAVATAAGVWLLCGPRVGLALHDEHGRGVVESVATAVLLCAAPAVLGILVAVRERTRRLGVRRAGGDVGLVLGHLVVAVAAVAVLAPLGAVAAAVFTAVLFVPEALACALLLARAQGRAHV
ncbi:hypothetical protein [Streptomyces sp. enrichment culture]|uniref:hypothetical protein n=1 Tax=Streptomyces sp. enrichment culture TaxID=1795815 RepID=UPI003F5753D2